MVEPATSLSPKLQEMRCAHRPNQLGAQSSETHDGQQAHTKRSPSGDGSSHCCGHAAIWQNVHAHAQLSAASSAGARTRTHAGTHTQRQWRSLLSERRPQPQQQQQRCPHTHTQPQQHLSACRSTSSAVRWQSWCAARSRHCCRSPGRQRPPRLPGPQQSCHLLVRPGQQSRRSALLSRRR